MDVSKDIDPVLPFCSGNKVNISISRPINTHNQEKFSLTGTLTAGETVKLNMNFYMAAKPKKKDKSIINDYASVCITFTLPESEIKKNTPASSPATIPPSATKSDREMTVLPVDTDLSPPVELSPEEAEAWKQRRADSLLKVQILKLDCFITEKNSEIKALLTQVNELIEKNVKIEEEILSDIEIEADVLSKDVEWCKNNNAPALTEDKALLEKFTDFNKTHAKVMKRIEILRQETPPTNWAMYIGIALGTLFVGGMFSMQILNQLKVKRQQRRQQEEINREMRCRELENMDQPVEDI